MDMDRDDLLNLSLEKKVTLSHKIIAEAIEKFSTNLAIAFSGGKDSTTLLHLTQTAFNGRIPWKVFTLATGAEFSEITQFVQQMAADWNFELITLSNTAAIKTIEHGKDPVQCCYLLKAVPIMEAIKQYNLRALMVAVRWDEQEARINEDFFTQRNNPLHVRVQPLLHFREIDIWAYIKKHNLPYCQLYRQGYRSLDCEPCTRPHGFQGVERGGRRQGKEEVMRQLREAGYF
jgi:phosphoadenosine phosphosulfate reductase